MPETRMGATVNGNKCDRNRQPRRRHRRLIARRWPCEMHIQTTSVRGECKEIQRTNEVNSYGDDQTNQVCNIGPTTDIPTDSTSLTSRRTTAGVCCSSLGKRSTPSPASLRLFGIVRLPSVWRRTNFGCNSDISHDGWCTIRRGTCHRHPVDQLDIDQLTLVKLSLYKHNICEKLIVVCFLFYPLPCSHTYKTCWPWFISRGYFVFKLIFTSKSFSNLIFSACDD